MPENEITPTSVPDRIKDMLHQRRALGAELTALAGRDDETARARADAIAAEYAALDPLPEEYAEIADREFAEARAKFKDGLAEAAQARETLRAAKEKLAAAVAGLIRWTIPPLPMRPLKLRLVVLAQTSPLASTPLLMPRHAPQVALVTQKPASAKIPSSPSRSA